MEAFLTQGILGEMKLWTPEAGTPQGAVISPLLSNIYLDALDHTMAGKGLEMVRYADDFVVLCGTPEEAQQALEEVRRWTAQAGLSWHPVKTRIVDSTQPGGLRFPVTISSKLHDSAGRVSGNFETRSRPDPAQ